MPGGDRTPTGDGPPDDQFVDWRADWRADGRWRVERHAEVDSTNRVARDRARAGAGAGLVVVADHQTAGRGRLDRRWESPPGSSLLVSVLLPATTGEAPDARPADAQDAHRSVTAVAVALAQAVVDVAGIDVGVKWPNDLVVGDRKLAGVLAEAADDLVVVGAGCNVNWDAFPPELEATATACNLEAGRAVDRDALLEALLARLDGYLDAPASLVAAARARSTTLGRRVRVDQVVRSIEGTAVEIADDGALILRDDDGVTHTVVAGDVVHLRDA